MRAFALPLLLALGLPLPAAAAPVTVSISGVWDVVDDAGNELGGSVAPGTAFSATLLYDDTAPITYSDPTTANYDVGALPFAYTLVTGGFTFAWNGGFTSLDLINAAFDTVAGYFEDLVGAPGLPPFGLSYATLTLDDPSGTALSSTALAALPWSLAAWPTADAGIFFDVSDGNPLTYVELAGTITSLTVVPEPATWALVTGGLALLGASARRRRARA